MEIDVQFKSTGSSLLVNTGQAQGIWSFTKYVTADWNHEYFMVERTIFELTIFSLHITYITSKITDKKWTDSYVSSLDSFVNCLEKNDKQVLDHIKSSIDTDQPVKLKLVSNKKDIASSSGQAAVTVIEDFLHKQKKLTKDENCKTNITDKKQVVKNQDIKKRFNKKRISNKIPTKIK